jgi:hypothetical protein
MPAIACRDPVTDPIRPQQKREDEGHDHDLPNLHADVESRERGHGRIRWQPNLLQRAGEAEAVNEPGRLGIGLMLQGSTVRTMSQ